MVENREVLALVRYHVEGKEKEFRDQAWHIAKELISDGEEEAGEYICGLLSSDHVVPQEQKQSSG